MNYNDLTKAELIHEILDLRNQLELSKSASTIPLIGNKSACNDSDNTEELWKRESRYRLLFENMEEGFALQEIITDEKEEPIDFRFLEVNAAYERHTGMKPSDCVGKTILQVMPGADSEQIKKYGKVALTGEPLLFEYFSKTFNRHFRVRVFSPQFKMFATIFEDISEFKTDQLKLVESESRFKNMFAGHDSIMLLIDSDTGRIIDANASASKFYGYSVAELCSMNIDSINKLLPGQIQNEYKHAADQQKNYFVFPHQLSNGEERLVEVHSSPIEYKGKKILFSIINDITERQQLEEQLKSKSLLLEAQINSTIEGIVVVDKDMKRVLVNPQIIDLFKVPQSIVENEDSSIMLNHIVGLTKNPDAFLGKVRYIYQHSNEISRDEIELKNGKVLDRYCAPVLGKNGENYGRIWSFRDITALKKAESEVASLAFRYQTLLHAASDGIHVLDLKGKLIETNDAFCVMLGYTREEMLQLNIADWDAQWEGTELMSKMEEQTRNPSIFETRHRRKDGTIIDVEIHTSGVLLGGMMYQYAAARDITLRKQTENELKIKNEELNKVNAEKDKFFSVIAHDLRGPLGGIMGITEMLANKTTNIPETDRYDLMVELSNSARNTFNLLEQLLEWSRMERGLTEFQPQTLDLKKTIIDSLNLVIETAKVKSIEIMVNIPPETMVFADQNMLQTIIRNLVSNSVKFTREGGEVTISGQQGKDGTTLISVKDTGIGMNREILENLFRTDGHAGRPGTKGEPSTGLGLLLCKDFIEKHGGKIVVESEEGKGSVFSFTIPNYDPEKEVGMRNELPNGNVLNYKLNGLKVLVVDDDELTIRVISAMIRDYCREILIGRTGREAIEISSKNPDMDLILMDIAMPEINGYEATRRIREFNPLVVIIAQTTFSLPEDRRKAIEAGCNDYISKPYKINELIRIIKKYV